MTTRIEARFRKCRAEGRAALVTYVMAGDPDPETSLTILEGLPKAGADIVEFGLPFTDPMADGPAIQAAGLRALQGRADDGKDARSRAPLPRGGCRHARDPHGLLQPDLRLRRRPLPRRRQGRAASMGSSSSTCRRRRTTNSACRRWRPGSPSSGSRRRRPTTNACPPVLANTAGFVYYVSITGITGAATPDFGKVAAAVERIKGHTPLPVVVGFGVKTGAHAAAIAKGADGVVVGSALVEAVRASLDDDGKATSRTVDAVTTLVKDLSEGVRSVVKQKAA